MENKWKLFLDLLTGFSVIAIIIDYSYPFLSYIQQEIIYVFDFFALFLLAIDFYKETKKSRLPLTKFFVKHWYEIPSMVPLILFSNLEHKIIIRTIVKSFRLIGLFMIIRLFFRTITIFRKTD